jgi:hypothetical protein
LLLLLLLLAPAGDAELSAAVATVHKLEQQLVKNPGETHSLLLHA